jgi:hypothetical protein
MLICKELRFAFIHVPRTGGQSVRNTLAAKIGKPVVRSAAAQQAQKGLSDRLSADMRARIAPVLQRTPLKYFVTTAGHPSAALLRLTVKDFGRYKTFAFVRDPYRRILSAYVRAAAQGRFDGSLDDYLDGADRHLPPQANFVTFRGRVLVDFVGRFESLQADFDHVCDWIGMPRTALPAVASATQERADLLTENVRRRIEKTYAADFETFDYARP